MNLQSNLRFFLIFFIVFASSRSFTQVLSEQQQHEVDSIMGIINNPNSPDTAKAGNYIVLANYYYFHNVDTAIYFCEEGKRLSEKLDYTNGKSEAYGWLAYLYDVKGEPLVALEYYEKSLPLAIEVGNHNNTAVVINNMANIYTDLGRIEEALIYQYKARDVYEYSENYQGIGISHVNIGALFVSQGDTAEALKSFEEAIVNFEKVDYKNGLAYAYGNIGGLYHKRLEFEKALHYFDLSIPLRRELNDYIGLAMDLNNVGSILGTQGDYETALTYHLEALDYNQKVGRSTGIGLTYYYLGVAYYYLGDEEKALKYLEAGFESFTDLGNVEHTMRGSRMLAKMYAKQNKAQLALEMNDLHYQMRDSIWNLNNQKLAFKKQTEFDYEKKKVLDDANHQKEIAVKEADAKRQTVVLYFAIGGALLIAFFLVFVFNRLRITRKQKGIIEEQKKEVEQQKFHIEEVHQEITDSIAYAKRIQSAILPPQRLIKDHFPQSFVMYLPKDVVAGDFYWLEPTANGVLIAAADCTGHGVPGAMVSVVCNNALNRSVREYGLSEPGKILDKTREIVIQEFEKSDEEVKDGMDIAMCKFQGNKLMYAGAHNPLWIIRKGGEEVEEIKANKQPIGKFDAETSFDTHIVQLNPGDSVYIFSDGYPDQFGGDKGKKFKSKNLKQLLVEVQSMDMESQQAQLHKELESWKGGLEQVDDICIIGVRV